MFFSFLPIIVFSLFIFIEQTQQKPAIFLEVFDYNHDKKVNSTEIGQHYSNVKQKLSAAGLMNIMEKAENAGIGKKDDYLMLTKIAKIDPKIETLVKANDADHNGVFNMKEEEKLHKEYANKILDTNLDGNVNESESEAYDRELKTVQFKEFDMNKDGKLDGPELVPFSAKMLEPFKAMVGGMYPRLAQTPLPLAIGKNSFANQIGVSPEKIEAADLNKDGQLSFQTEFMSQIGLPPNIFMQLFKATPDLALSKIFDEKMLALLDMADIGENDDGLINYEELMMIATEQLMERSDLDRDGFLSLNEFQNAPFSAL